VLQSFQMDKLDNIYSKHGEWPQAVDIAETGISPEDLFNPELVSTALDLAKKNPRQRAIIRIHQDLSDENHLMINAILGDSYVQPHKHEEKEKTESFRILKGKAYVVFFDDDGKVEKKIEMSDTPDGRKIVVVRPDKWHTVVPVGEATLLLEAKRQPVGGYNPVTDKTMAPWAPDASNIESGQKYLQDLVASIDKVQ
jgi:cupin fold WbuC family metalloprotein